MSDGESASSGGQDSLEKTLAPPTSGGAVGSVRAILGPALITACVVLGPGSILTSSKVGTIFGVWPIAVLLLASGLMMAATMLSAQLGVRTEGSLCDELSRRSGKPVSILAGGTLFLIAGCFQFSNNVGVLASIDPLVQPALEETEVDQSKANQQADNLQAEKPIWPMVVLVALNAAIIATLFGFKTIYAWVEKLMMVLVAAMLVGFAANLAFAILVPPEAIETPIPPGTLASGWPVLVAMVATTFSAGGAFFQAYLVRQKGWSIQDARRSRFDTIIGIGLLGLISMMILVTAGLVMHGRVPVASLDDAGQVARQLEPLFGPWAKYLFCLGLFAGAFSSFLANALIGGTLLSDVFGGGGNIDKIGPKIGTMLCLLLGMGIALWMIQSGERPVDLIIFAQGMTVVGNPVLIGCLLWLGTRQDLRAKGPGLSNPLLILVAVGLVVVMVLAGNKVFSLVDQLQERFGGTKTSAKPALIVPEELVVQMVAHARQESPRECVGLLAGTGDLGQHARAQSVTRLQNEHPEADSFFVSHGLIAPLRALRESGQQLLAIYHSHPASPAIPSRRDHVQNYYPPSVGHLILSLAEGRPMLRLWRLDGADRTELTWACPATG